MRGRPYTSTLARPVPAEVGNSPGNSTTGDDCHRSPHKPSATSRDVPPPPPRPRTTTGLLSRVDGCDSINYYSTKYRSRHSIPHVRVVLPTTPLNRKSGGPDTTGQSIETRGGYLSEVHLLKDHRQISSTTGDDEHLARGNDNISRRPSTAYRKNSDVITSYSEIEILPLKRELNKDADHPRINHLNTNSSSGQPHNFGDSSDKGRSRNERGDKFFKRGERTKRKTSNGVTFVVPPPPTAHKSTRGSGRAPSHRRMSAPELPPILDRGGHGGTPRGDKRKTSVNSLNSSGSKASTSHPAHSINGKTLTSSKVSTTVSNGVASNPATTKKKKGQLPRNYSDPSLTQLPGNSSTVSHDSSSTNVSHSTANGGDGYSGTGPRHIKFLSKTNRALSWCATDNLGSQAKLETLFEGQSNHNNNNNQNPNIINNSNMNHVSTSPPSHPPMRYSLNKTSSNGSSTNLISMVSNANAINNNNHHHTTDMPPIIPPVLVSAAGHRSRKDTSRRQSFTKKTGDDGGHFPESPRGRMQRSNSENKLAHSHDFISENQHKAVQRVEARNFSVDRIDRYASPPRPQTKSVAPATHAKNRLQRVGSVTALNVNNNNNSRRESKLHEDDDVFADDENYEKNARVFKWVIEVSNVDEFDTDPKDAYVEYTDETPQTDTAIHLVYNEQ